MFKNQLKFSFVVVFLNSRDAGIDLYLVSSELTSVLWFMSINGEISNRSFQT